MQNKTEQSKINNYSLNNPYKFGILIFLTMLYVTCKLSCNPMFFRQAEFSTINYSMKINCSSLIFPAIYILSDIITFLTSRKIAIFIIIFGIICDGIFSYTIHFVVNLNNPDILLTNQSIYLEPINHIGNQMWLLYYSGVIAAMIAAIGEVLLFSFIFKKLKSFFISTSVSIITTLLLHNTINEYAMLKHEADAWHIISSNLILDASIMFIYVSIISIIMKIIRIFYLTK